MQARTIRRLLTAVAPILALAGCDNQTPPTAAPSNRLALDAVAATCTVTSTGDAGAGSLRVAIADPACSTITFGLTLPATITLTSAQLTIDRNVSIEGPGADKLTVARSVAAGTPSFTIFVVQVGVTSAISGITVSHGNASVGGGIYNDGVLTLSRIAVTENTAVFVGGVANSRTGNMTITHSLIANNTAAANSGGVENKGVLILANSTVSGNTSGNNGGGVNEEGSGSTLITHSTITGNSAAQSGGGIRAAGTSFGPNGIGSTLTIRNSVIAGNTAALYPDMSSATFSPRASYTLFGIFAGFGIAGSGPGGNLFSSTGPLDPKLGPLTLNGPGTTATHALLKGSPAIDAGICTDEAGSDVTDDQRGFARPQGPKCDMGAFEKALPTPVELTEDLIGLAAGTPGLSKGTLSKLDGALVQIRAGKTASACGKLAEFITDVQDHRGKNVATAAADALIAGAQKIRVALGC
jgi:hypothetical protein